MKISNHLQIDEFAMPIVEKGINIDPDVLARTREHIESTLAGKNIYTSLPFVLFAVQLLCPNEFNDLDMYWPQVYDKFNDINFIHKPAREFDLSFPMFYVAFKLTYPNGADFNLGTKWEEWFVDQLINHSNGGSMLPWLGLKLAFPQNEVDISIDSERAETFYLQAISQIEYGPRMDRKSTYNLLGWTLFLTRTQSPVLETLTKPALESLDTQLAKALDDDNIVLYWTLLPVKYLLEGGKIVPGTNRLLEFIHPGLPTSAESTLPNKLIYV